MDWLATLETIGQIVLIPLIGAAAIFAVAWLNAKTNDLKQRIKDERAQKYLTMLNNSITTCVIATSQTYVSVLKKDGIFNAEAQKKALQMTYDAVMKTLTEDAKTLLTEVVGDLQSYILNSIEADVAQTKNYIQY